jgi:hypothetical protein
MTRRRDRMETTTQPPKRRTEPWAVAWTATRQAARTARAVAYEAKQVREASEAVTVERRLPDWWLDVRRALESATIAVRAELALTVHATEDVLAVVAAGGHHRYGVSLRLDGGGRTVAVERTGPRGRDLSHAALALIEETLVAEWQGARYATPEDLVHAVVEPWLTACWEDMDR